MELTEPIESINAQLVDLFGIDTITGEPIYRVVWSEDQIEKRLTSFTKDGFQLLTPIVREIPKYRQWIQEKFILERLTIVPEINKDEIITKTSYEPLWVFEDNNGNFLPPALWACKFCIDTVHAALGRSSLAKYVDEEAKNPVEYREQRIQQMEKELFGNETATGDALAHDYGVVNSFGPTKIKGNES